MAWRDPVTWSRTRMVNSPHYKRAYGYGQFLRHAAIGAYEKLPQAFQRGLQRTRQGIDTGAKWYQKHVFPRLATSILSYPIARRAYNYIFPKQHTLGSHFGRGGMRQRFGRRKRFKGYRRYKRY